LNSFLTELAGECWLCNLGKNILVVVLKGFDIKSKHFSNALRDSSLYVISCIRQPVAQELDKIHILHVRKFCRPTSGVSV